MRASEFITEKKSRKKTKVRKAAYGPGLYGGYGYFSTYGNSDSTGGDGGDGGGESIHENITPNTIHKLADRKGVKWDNEPSFLRLTKRLTGKEHLDDLDQVGLQKVQRHLEKQGIDENFADGRNPQDKGDAKRHGVNTKGSVSSLRKVAKQGGRKGQLAHWMANMKAGRNK